MASKANESKFKTDAEVLDLAYSDLTAYAKSIDIRFTFQQRDDLQQLCIAKRKGKSVSIPIENQVNVFEDDYAKYPQYPDSKEQVLLVGRNVRVDPIPATEELAGDVALLNRMRNAVRAGGGYLSITNMGKGFTEMKPYSGDESDVLILPTKLLIVVDIPHNANPESIEVDDNAVQYVGVEGIKKGHSPQDAVDKFNELNGISVEVVAIEKKRQGKDKVFTLVTLKYGEKSCQVSATKTVLACAAGGLTDLIETNTTRSGGATKKGKTMDDTLTTEQQAIVDNSKFTKSDKIRKLYRLDVTVATIHRVLGIHYSFAYCVVDKYRKMLKPKESNNE